MKIGCLVKKGWMMYEYYEYIERSKDMKSGVGVFVRGEKVECVNSDMGKIAPCLEKGRIYTIREFVPPEYCVILGPNNNICHWDERGGRVNLLEKPLCFFFGYRFLSSSMNAL